MEPRKRGRPKGSTSRPKLQPETDIGERRDSSVVHNRKEHSILHTATEECASTSKSTTSNRNIYLVKQTVEKFAHSKIPKQSYVIRRFLLELQRTGTIKTAAATTANELCEVWKFHFGMKLIMGKNTIDDKEDETMKLVIKTCKIEKKIIELYTEWKELEKTSKRKDRCIKDSFKTKEQNLLERLDLPMDISKRNCEDILKKAKIIEWKDDLKHLRQQLSKEQVGCAMGYDMKQEARDRAKRQRGEELEERKEREHSEFRTGSKFMKVEMESSGTESEMDGDCDSSDDVKVRDRAKRKKDIMTVVSPLSIKQRSHK
jgi:hypothetical protein